MRCLEQFVERAVSRLKRNMYDYSRDYGLQNAAEAT